MIRLVLGGDKSGKSAYALAQLEADRGPHVLLATGQAADFAFRQQILDHRTARDARIPVRETGADLVPALRQAAAETESNLHVQGVGSVFSISFTTKPEIVNWRDHARNCDDAMYAKFARAMLEHGVRLSSNGRIHMSSAHTDEDVQQTVEAARKVLPTL